MQHGYTFNNIVIQLLGHGDLRIIKCKYGIYIYSNGYIYSVAPLIGVISASSVKLIGSILLLLGFAGAFASAKK